MMGSPWSALLCTSLLLPLLIISISYAEDAVSFMQTGSSNEPFDVDGTIAYNIPINNSIGYNMLYTVTLTIGSDKDNPYIMKNFEKSQNVNAHSVSYATFNVNLRSSEIYKGDFAKWALDKNDTSIWEKAWYHAEITPLVGKSISLEGYNGHPQLIKPVFKFENQRVNPTEGNNKDLYSYEVMVLGNYRDNISLQVAPSIEGPWIDLGSQEYSTPNQQQTLRWGNNRLDFDFNKAYYKFTGRKSSKVFGGPFWPVAVEYRNSSVIPGRGLLNTFFSYSLEVNSSKSIDVGLNVLDVATKTFKAVGRRSYGNNSRWEKLDWSDIRPSDIPGSEGSSNYYYSFYYPGDETPFNSTLDKSGSYYQGPEIVLMEFKNATVTPQNGSVLTPFNYSIEINTALPRADVELQTSDPGSAVWRSQGLLTYDGSNKILHWNDVSIDGWSGGSTSYRFLSDESHSDVYSGPAINGSMITRSSVEPYNGSLYFTNILEGSIARVYTLIFAADMSQAKGREPVDINLEIYDPVARTWINAGTQTYDPSRSMLNFTVNMARLSFKGPFLGETRYRFVSNDRMLGEFAGPYIDVNFRNESAVEAGSKITYRTEVRSSLPKLAVALDYTADNIKWLSHPDKRIYESGTEEWKILEWKEYPRYYAYEFEALRGQA